MAAPKIKFYQVPRGYKVEQDLDVQQTIGDELLPCIDKNPISRDAAVVLSGIIPAIDTPMFPFDLNAGRSVSPYPLTYNGNHWVPSGINMNQILVGPTGFLELRVLDVSNNVLLPTGYVVVRNGMNVPIGFDFNPGTNPSGRQISCWQTPASMVTNSHWALGHDQAYDGDNETFNQIIVTANGGSPAAYQCPVGASGAWTVLPSGIMSATATYWFRATKTRYFCGENTNWIPGQDSKARENTGQYLGYSDMGPDVFVGMTDYAGDGVVVPDNQPNAGAYIDPGLVPDFVDPGSYSITHRDGLVRFPGEIDTAAIREGAPSLVRANYAHLVGIRNVSQQELTPAVGSSGKIFLATSEKVFVESHGKRWVGRNDEIFPLKIYVQPSGSIPQLTPSPQSILPYEVLTPKLSA